METQVNVYEVCVVLYEMTRRVSMYMNDKSEDNYTLLLEGIYKMEEVLCKSCDIDGEEFLQYIMSADYEEESIKKYIDEKWLPQLDERKNKEREQIKEIAKMITSLKESTMKLVDKMVK